MPALAHRSDLAPRARLLLAQQRDEFSELLDPLVRGALDDLEHDLFAIGARSSGGQVQHEALEDLREVREHRGVFQARLQARVAHAFDALGKPGQDEPARPAPALSDELKLVEPGEFDESMALDGLVSRIELRAGNRLFELCHRYAVLLAAPPLDNDALPVGPRMVAAALQHATEGLGIRSRHRVVLYRGCARRLSEATEAVYGHLNENLKTAGILPHLRSYLRRPNAQDEGDPGEIGIPDEPPVGSAPQPPPGQPRGDHGPAPLPGLDELHRLLDAHRRATRATAASEAAAAQAGQFASMPELQEALGALQAMPSRKSGPQSGAGLADELHAALRRVRHGQAVELPPEQRDAVDLMALLYDQLLGETRTKATTRDLLAGLQVPLLRVALTDSAFFTVRNHPARRLLNLVLETADVWLDQGGEHVDTALRQRLERAVQRVAGANGDDVGTMSSEADELESHLRNLQRRARIAERRHVEAAQGHDRLHQARAQAGAAIADRIGKRAVTPLVRALLENAWVDALTLTLLREGEHSESYRRRLASADELLGPAEERDTDRLAEELTHGLTQVGLQEPEAAQVARQALGMPRADDASPSAPAAPSQTELLVRLKSRHKPEAAGPAAAAHAPQPLPLTTSERRALDVLQGLPFGSWLEFTVNQQGRKVARKLAWYAPASGRCLLVNAHGTPARERTLEQVARLMARGQARVLPQNGGMIDRAWATLVAGLRKLGGGRAGMETAT